LGGFCPYHGKDYEIYFFYTGTGLQIPPAAQQALQMSGSLAFGAVADLQTRLSQQTEASALAAAASVQPLATQCFQLSNMFNPQT